MGKGGTGTPPPGGEIQSNWPAGKERSGTCLFSTFNPFSIPIGLHHTNSRRAPHVSMHKHASCKKLKYISKAQKKKEKIQMHPWTTSFHTKIIKRFGLKSVQWVIQSNAMQLSFFFFFLQSSNELTWCETKAKIISYKSTHTH